MNKKIGENTLSSTVKKPHIASMSFPIDPPSSKPASAPSKPPIFGNSNWPVNQVMIPHLTLQLKKDLDWMKQQEHSLEENNDSKFFNQKYNSQ